MVWAWEQVLFLSAGEKLRSSGGKDVWASWLARGSQEVDVGSLAPGLDVSAPRMPDKQSPRPWGPWLAGGVSSL